MGMIRAAEKGEIKALLLLGVDPLAAFPDTDRTQKALTVPDLVVRTGMFPATGEETAHILLPIAAMTETDGTYVRYPKVEFNESRNSQTRRVTCGRPLASFLILRACWGSLSALSRLEIFSKKLQ